MNNSKSIRELFWKSLNCGTGEAFLLFKKYLEIDFSDMIIKGAVKNLSYDNQSEGSRADYIYKFITNSKHKDVIIKNILKKTSCI